MNPADGCRCCDSDDGTGRKPVCNLKNRDNLRSDYGGRCAIDPGSEGWQNTVDCWNGALATSFGVGDVDALNVDAGRRLSRVWNNT